MTAANTTSRSASGADGDGSGKAWAAGMWAQRTMALLLAFLALRIASLWFNNSELFFDEAQYWFWASDPALGYFSKPPLLAWIIAAATSVCGDSEFCVRLPSPLLHTVTAGLMFAIGRKLFDARTGFWTAATYLLLPSVTLSSHLISTDVPLLMLWAAALLAFLHLEESNGTGAAVAMGVAIGLGMLAKYAMAYFLLCAAIYSLLAPERPHLLARPKFWLGLAIAALVFSPNILWNLLNGNPTVAHTGENIGWRGNFPNLGGLAEFLGSQFAVMGPVLFGIYIAALIRLPREGMNRQQGLLIAFSAPVLLLICFQAIMSKAYANWAAVTYIAGVVLVTDLMVNRIPDWWLRLSTSIHVVVFAVISVAVAFAGPGQLPLPSGMRPFERMQGARDVATGVKERIASGEYRAVMVDDRRMAALMNYYLRDTKLPVLSWRDGPAPRDHFEMVRPYQDNPVAPVLYVTRRSNPVGVVSKFAEAELLGDLQPPAGEIRQVWFYALRNSPAPR